MIQWFRRNLRQLLCTHRWHLFAWTNVHHPKRVQRGRITVTCVNCSKMKDIHLDRAATAGIVRSFCEDKGIAIKDRRHD